MVARRGPALCRYQFVALVAVIALMNAYNRMNVIIRQPAGDYRPGQFG